MAGYIESLTDKQLDDMIARRKAILDYHENAGYEVGILTLEYHLLRAETEKARRNMMKMMK
jgi:hypothetical protein